MQRLLAIIGLLALIATIGVGAYLYFGFYSVAASSANPGFVDMALKQVRVKSIQQHASERPPAGLSLIDPAVVQEGARAFATRGCVLCHGAPGVTWAKFSEGLNPSPPDLKEEVALFLSPSELFWVIKNGIEMTGMPSFGKIEVPDKEIWSIVAFVKQLPSVTDEQFKMWTAAGQNP
jgi:mono/diheme cytochrome c family protein